MLAAADLWNAPRPRPALVPVLSSCPLPRVSASSDEGLHYQKDTLSLLARCGPDAGTPFSARIPFNVPAAPSGHLRANQKLLTWAMSPYWRIWRLKKIINKQRFSRGREEPDNEDGSVFSFSWNWSGYAGSVPPGWWQVKWAHCLVK